MTIKAVRKLWFCAGHRVFKHESKCANLHGHNYTLFVYAESDQLDSVGRVIDFSEIKKRIDPWLQDNFDHKFLVYKKDSNLTSLLGAMSEQFYLMPINPTAENIALHLINEVIPGLMKGSGIQVTKLKLYETENCYVEVGSD